MSTSKPVGIAVLAACIGVVGCVEPYTVVRQARPNPLYAQKSFALMPLDFSEMLLHDDDAPGHKGIDRSELERGKNALGAAFEHEFIASLGEQGIHVVRASAVQNDERTFLIQPRVSEITPGEYTGSGGQASLVRVDVAIFAPTGQLLDEVKVEHGTEANPFAGDTPTRLGTDGSSIGERLAGYVHERVVPGSELQ